MNTQEIDESTHVNPSDDDHMQTIIEIKSHNQRIKELIQELEEISSEPPKRQSG